jgi:hypothetical protein
MRLLRIFTVILLREEAVMSHEEGKGGEGGDRERFSLFTKKPVGPLKNLVTSLPDRTPAATEERMITFTPQP